MIARHNSTETYDATLVYQPDEATRSGKTVVRVPATWLYPEGYSVGITPEGVGVWEVGCCDIRANSSLTISLAEEWSGEEVAVTISSK